jgi:hypothetical protein
MTDLLDPPTEVLDHVDATVDLTAYREQLAAQPRQRPATYIVASHAARPDRYTGRRRRPKRIPQLGPWTAIVLLGCFLLAFSIAGFVMMQHAADAVYSPAPAFTTVPAPAPGPQPTVVR